MEGSTWIKLNLFVSILNFRAQNAEKCLNLKRILQWTTELSMQMERGRFEPATADTEIDLQDERANNWAMTTRHMMDTGSFCSKCSTQLKGFRYITPWLQQVCSHWGSMQEIGAAWLGGCSDKSVNWCVYRNNSFNYKQMPSPKHCRHSKLCPYPIPCRLLCLYHPEQLNTDVHSFGLKFGLNKIPP